MERLVPEDRPLLSFQLTDFRMERFPPQKGVYPR
jgi:hypothetical protein